MLPRMYETLLSDLKFKNRVINFKDQQYNKILKELTLTGELFEDPHFPASNSSLGDTDSNEVEWKRPGELCEFPRLYIPGQTHPGARAGTKSNPWIVSACSVLAGIPELYHRIMPDSSGQDWSEEQHNNYVGIFSFRFWHFGSWVDVVVDDRLPTVGNNFLFTSSSQQGEYWISLLEKAYAKLHGSYQGLEFGHLSDALVDFTGGVAEVYDVNFEETELSDSLAHLMETIVTEINNHSIICLKINVKPGDEHGERVDMGLHRGSTYQITGAKYVTLGETKLQSLFSNKGRIPMVRIRDTEGWSKDTAGLNQNDTGNGSSDSGKGSGKYVYSTTMLSRLLSRNSKWAQVKESEQHRMGLTLLHSSEFWMPLDDLPVFDEVTVIHFYTNNAFSLLQRWRESKFTGHWTQGLKGTSSDRSGGCAEYQDTFLRNPQYALDIQNSEQTVVVQILQWTGEDRCKFISEEQLPLLVGFSVIKVEENRCHRLSYQWEFCPTVISVHPIRKRQLFYTGTLATGRYILIPHTHRPGEVGGFLLRTFAQSNIKLKELTKDRPSRYWPSFLFKYPTHTTVVVVEKVNNVIGNDSWVQLKCEGKTAKTRMTHKSSQPAWNMAFIFYRAKIEKPISVKLYCRRWAIFHTLLGQAELPALVNHCLTPLEVTLHNKLDEATESTLSLQILTNDSILCI